VSAAARGYHPLDDTTDKESALNEDAEARERDVERSTDEPALTERNTETIRGEDILAGDDRAGDSVPAAYGKGGGTTDATEEGGDGTGT
jgi:hypothetical protein